MRKTHWTIDQVSHDIGERFDFNTAQSAVHELVNQLQRSHDETTASSAGSRWRRRSRWCSPTRPTSPASCGSGWAASALWDAPWPVADPAMLVADEITYAVQVNGKLRGEFDGRGRRRARRPARGRAGRPERGSHHLDGAEVVKEIVVPGKLVSLVTR